MDDWAAYLEGERRPEDPPAAPLTQRRTYTSVDVSDDVVHNGRD